MFRATAILASIIGAAAFAPAARNAASSSLKMSFESEAGVTAPLGYFDPLKLAKDAETFQNYRAAEIKHGRVAQLAVVGYVVPEILRFPIEIAPGVPASSIPNGLAALTAIPSLGWLQMFFLIGAVDYWGFFTYDTNPENIKPKVYDQELNHGRLAMIAILELLRHDSQKLIGGMYATDNLITGLPFLYQ